MGLEGEAPAGAGEDAGDGFLRIGAGAGLEEMPVGGEAGPAVHGCVVTGIDQLEFIGAGEDDAAVAPEAGDVRFRTEGDPVGPLRNLTGPVGLDMDKEAGGMEGFHQAGICLERRLAARKADAPYPASAAAPIARTCSRVAVAAPRPAVRAPASAAPIARATIAATRPAACAPAG